MYVILSPLILSICPKSDDLSNTDAPDPDFCSMLIIGALWNCCPAAPTCILSTPWFIIIAFNSALIPLPPCAVIVGADR